MADIELKFAGLIEISNQVNRAVVEPLARSVAARAISSAPRVSGDYADSIDVEVDPRTGVNDFAHCRVVARSAHAMIVEARTGNLARALHV